MTMWINIHLMYGPEGNSEFCFPESPNVSRDEVEGNIRTENKTNCFPRDNLIAKTNKQRRRASDTFEFDWGT